MKTTVVNIKYEKCDVYIGRGSKWGNPYKIDDKIGMTREHVIELYRSWIMYTVKGKELQKYLDELKDKSLGCYCKPLACHGEILIELIENIENGKNLFKL